MGTTLQQRLAQAEPRDFALKAAWTPLIRALRRRRGRGGPVGLASRAEVERALAREVACSDGVVSAIKTDLRALVRGGLDDAEAEAVAARVDEALWALLPAAQTGPLRVEVRGWPPGFGQRERRRLLGGLVGGETAAALAAGEETVAAVDGAVVRRALHGMVLAGRPLEVVIPQGVLLPSVPRDRRGRRPSRPPAWLPHLDEVGRTSLSPRSVAEAQARWLSAGRVIDAFCGCGGNAIAFALSGAEVVAIEREPARLALARANAAALGARGIHFAEGDAAVEVPRWRARWPDAATFLDPPWGDPPADRWEHLVPPGLRTVEGPVMVKAPRSFDVASAPGGWADWQVRYGFGEVGTSEHAVVKMLTLLRRDRRG